MDASPAIVIREMVLRDGLQNEPNAVPTPDKLQLAISMKRAGIRQLQAAAFVHPARVPQMADAEQVIEGLLPLGLHLSALVPNLRGFQRAITAGVPEIEVVVSATEEHNLNNVGRSRQESLDEIASMVASVDQHPSLTITVALACAFGCPFTGDVSIDAVLEMVDALATRGIRGVSISDTIGVAAPREVEPLFRSVQARFPEVTFGAHFHDTRGAGVANAWTALEAGVTTLDSSLGGLGGCPFAPGAAGNVATEDLVYMLDRGGFKTGVDISLLLTSVDMLRTLVRHDLPSRMSHVRSQCSPDIA